MIFSVVTIFPEMFSAIKDHGVIGRALHNGNAELSLWNPRDYSDNKHKNVDDKPFGGGPGMVMTPAPIEKAIEAATKASDKPPWVIELTPKGKRLDQKKIQEIQSKMSIILLCGRYEGIDERISHKHVDEQISLGDFVISGGELAAMTLIDAVTRLLPGALGDEESAQQDSFFDDLLDYPHYTRPQNFNGLAVPEVLLSGDHQRIAVWRKQQALGQTWEKRPDLLAKKTLSPEEQTLLNEYIEQTTEELKR